MRSTALVGAALMMISGIAVMALSAFSEADPLKVRVTDIHLRAAGDNVQWYTLWVSIRENPNGGEYAIAETALVPVDSWDKCHDTGVGFTEDPRSVGEITRRYMCIHLERAR